MQKYIEFGIVQGRLIQSPEGCLQWFPQEHWDSEFFLASALGFNYIELIAERQHNKNNPIWSNEGIEKIKSISKRNNLSLHAFCNDYIIDHSLTDTVDALEQTLKLISQLKLLKIQKLILPLFEKSELTENNFDEYRTVLKNMATEAQENNILICLETVLNGKNLLRFLEYLGHRNVKCVFDTGNRVAFGHDIYSDILLLGEQIHHIHIKDKDDGNNNVFLGAGKVNFYKVFKSLSTIGYKGPYTFETLRGKDPVRTAKYNKLFVEFFLSEVQKNES